MCLSIKGDIYSGYVVELGRMEDTDMKLAYGSSKKGDVSEALRTITEPAALFFSVA